MTTLAKLKYSGPILNKGASADATRARLKDLHEKLKLLEQDHTDLGSLAAVRKQLLDKSLFLHKDKGVKAYCVCCLADMLRLYAPDSPYNDDQLKDIFVFMLTQVSHHLKATPVGTAASRSRTPAATRITDIPYYSEYYYLLDSLATIRSICLVPDLNGGVELTKDWIVGLFSILRPDMNKHFIRILQEIMVALLDEASSLPEGLMEEVLLDRLNHYQNRPDHPAFLLAVAVMRNAAPKLQRSLYIYVADVHDRHGRDPTDDDLDLLENMHRTLILLFNNAPEVLLNVIPQLEEALQGNVTQLRVLTTRTLGSIFGSSSGGNQNVAEVYQSTWQVWMGRRADRSISVRTAWVEAAQAVLSNHSELRAPIQAGLLEKLIDVEDKVRATACRVFGAIEYEVAAHHVALSTLKVIGDRLKDKKASVSEQAFESLGHLYSSAFGEIESGDEMAIRQFGWIPQSFYNSLSENASVSHRQNVELVTKKYILPLPGMKGDVDADVHWVDRLLTVCRNLNDYAFANLLSLSNLSSPALEPWLTFIRACEAYNGGTIDHDEVMVTNRLKQIIQYLARSFADHSRAQQDLMAFAKLNDKKTYKLFVTSASLGTDVEGLVKAQNDLVRRIETSLPEIQSTITLMLQKASFWIINKSSIPNLFKRSSSMSPSKTGAQAHRILVYISKYRPQMLFSHISAMEIALLDNRAASSGSLALQCLAQALASGDREMQLESRTIDRAVQLCTVGTAIEGKYAARLLSSQVQANGRERAIVAISAKLEDSEPDELLLAPLSASKEFFKRGDDNFRQTAVSILDKITSKVLFSSTSSKSELESWTRFEDLDGQSQCKVLGLKACIQFCLMEPESMRPDTESKIEEIVQALHYVVANVGRISENTNETGALAGHLRLVAASGLTKLAAFSRFDNMITNNCFEEIAFEIQDAYFPVRYVFLQKLHKYLLKKRYSPRWYILPFLVAHDVEEDVKELGIRIIRDIQTRLPDKHKVHFVEKPFVRLLSLLAHHPDFENTGIDDLIAMSQYIDFFLNEVTNSRNISLIYHLANRIKTVQDSKDSGDRLYMLSELAQLLLQRKARAQQWTIDDYAGKQNMPTDIFLKLPNEEVSKQLSRKQFLPESYIHDLSGAVQKKLPKTTDHIVIASPNPRKRPTPRKPKPRKRRKFDGDDGTDTAGELTPGSDSDEEEEAIVVATKRPDRTTTRTMRAESESSALTDVSDLD